ncbi:enhanced intracellular survival protein Eis [Veillonella sp. R32]|uniref:GNAT family N-acetyltransferase n=1 Tax=Veillonella sp. R32 TaxID=2021312 RepID=UPI001389DC64|nr:GNAT family N-acetyltransferase [Veillonella sp. R32]KAF1678760.1 GNAT family N-acetyltransferase [Veillonella sp. R32]
MEFRIATAQDTEAVKNLWAYCFETAEDPFFQYYFSKAYEPEHTMVGYEGKLLASMVHLRQYTLQVRGAQLPVSYMVGVATDPVARRGGIGGQLLLASLEELKRRGQGMTILMPSKAAFYQQYGWELYAHQWVQTMSLEELRPLTDKTLHFGLLQSDDEWSKLSPVYEAYTKGLSGYAVRGETEWRRLLGSFFAEGVRVAYVADEAGSIEGYAVYRLGAEEIPVTEFVYTSRRAQKGLLNYLYNHRSQGSSIRWNEGLQDESYIFHPNGKTGHTTMPYMMSRIVDVATAMASVPVHIDSNWQHRPNVSETGQYTFTLGVKDGLASWNEGTYEITVQSDGMVQANKVADTITAKAQVISEVGALSLLLMGRLRASELVFEGKLTGGEAVVTMLDRLYPKQNTYINEWW